LVNADGVPANSSDARVETREVWAVRASRAACNSVVQSRSLDI
jgi:hypothetical protein